MRLADLDLDLAFRKSSTTTIGHSNCYFRSNEGDACKSKSARRFSSEKSQRIKEIEDLGRLKKWKQILEIYEHEGHEFSSGEYAKTLSNLKNAPSLDTRHPTLARLVDDLATLIEDKGLRWMGSRDLAWTIHALGKMNIKSRSAKKIVDFVTTNQTIAAIWKDGDPVCV